MIGILRRNAFYYVLYGIFFMAMSAIMWQDAYHNLRPPIAVINSFFMFFMVVVPALSAEGAEEKNKGYVFLKTLPLTLGTVIRAKFMLPLISLAVIVAYNFILFTFFTSTPENLAICQKLIVMNADLLIVIAGLVFIVMYRFGIRNFMVVMVVSGVLLNLAGLITFRSPGKMNFFELGPVLVENAPMWLLAAIAPVSLLIYFWLYRVALRIKSERLFD